MQHVASIIVDRPIADVFRLTTEHVADWSLVVVKDEVLKETPDGVGTTFHTITEEHGKQMEFSGVVTRCDPPHAHAVKMTGAMFDIETEFLFEKVATGTLVTQTAAVTGKGFVWLMMLLFGWLMTKSQCDASAKELESLKAYCERELPAAAG